VIKKRAGKEYLKRIVILTIGIILVVIFFACDLQQYLNLNYLKDSRNYFTELYTDKPGMVIGSYMLTYILITALSLPGATILTLAGGALFGLANGVIIVSFASSIGATIACFTARFLLRDWIQKKFSNKFEIINQGIAREGAFYLFTLRLIPVFPFFMINLVMGLTRMSLFTFYWVSQVGMLAATIVYVNAGKELAKLKSLSGILSPSLLGAFVILGIFPLVVKKLVVFFNQKNNNN
jgi:uncharacterized membrane protein YdjX (TVP38/TMEM64 family)